jgi:hypothetical protein
LVVTVVGAAVVALASSADSLLSHQGMLVLQVNPQAIPLTLYLGVTSRRSGVGKMLVAGAVEIDGGKPRRARLKVRTRSE